MNEKDDKQIEMLRQEYERIPVPPQAESRIQAGIARAKKERKGVIIMKMFKNTGATAAAAVLAITALTNINPAIANAMEQIPVIGSIARVVTFRTYEDKKENTEAEIKVPQVTQENGSGREIPANKSIQEYADQLIASYEEEVSRLNGEGRYAMESSYKVVTDNSKYLSIRIDTTVVMASGAQYVKIFTIDKATGRAVTLPELLKNNQEVLNAVSDNIKEQMAEEMAGDGSIVYFYNSDTPDTDFKGLTGEESFYFNDKGELVIAFNEYDVAPGYMGAVDFTIPSSVSGIPTD
ncbi:MAG: DUF3298 and DUF4163 domain-containing protein [Clostridium sp.]|nr:DUF3298 and DUF4163 domain-containing protein [Clostridium sp.]